MFAPRYRIGATIQIVLVLSILIYAYNDTMPAIYVILLALVTPSCSINKCASGCLGHVGCAFSGLDRI